MLAVYTIVKPAAELGWGAATTLAYDALQIGRACPPTRVSPPAS